MKRVVKMMGKYEYAAMILDYLCDGDRRMLNEKARNIGSIATIDQMGMLAALANKEPSGVGQRA